MQNRLHEKTKNCRNLIFKFQKKFLSVVLHNCRENAAFARFRDKVVGSDALSSWAEVQSSNMFTTVLSFLNLVPAHKNREKNLSF